LLEQAGTLFLKIVLKNLYTHSNACGTNFVDFVGKLNEVIMNYFFIPYLHLSCSTHIAELCDHYAHCLILNASSTKTP